MAKYGEINGKYYTVGEGSQLQQISEQDILGRRGDIPGGASLDLIRKEGDLMNIDSSKLAIGTDGALSYGGGTLSLGGSAAYVKPGTTMEQFGTLPFNQDFSNYLKDTSQTYNTQTGFSGAPGITSTAQYNAGVAGGTTNPTTGQPIQQETSKFQQGFESATNAGVGTNTPDGPGANGTGLFFTVDGKQYYSPTGNKYDAIPADQAPADARGNGGISSEDARGFIEQYTPKEAVTNQAVDSFFHEDLFMQNIVRSFQDYISPSNQRKSLTETYQQMVKDSGIQALDTEMINMKNIIDGTEDDIRKEVMSAGGIATESQVLALASARNKQLIKNYNTLLETRNAKEKYLNTMIGLEAQDRQEADQRFERSFNMAMQIADFGQKMKKNAIEAFDRVKDSIGWSGILQSVQGDPTAIRLIEKSYGLPAGGLAIAAQKELKERGYSDLEKELDLKYKQAQIDKIYGDMNGTGDLKTEIREIQGKDYLINSETGDIIKEITPGETLGIESPETQKQLAFNKEQIDQVNNILNSGTLKTAVGPNIFSRYGKLRGMLTPNRSNFIGSVEQLRSQLNLQSLIDAKARGATFGALSDQELQMLSSSATKIGSWLVDKNDSMKGYNVTESAFKKELDKINNFAKLDYLLKGGNPQDVGVFVTPNGEYMTKNSDGSVTNLEFKKSKAQKSTSINNNVKALATSIISQESGGRYNAVGEVPAGYSEADKALGRYQIVPKYHFQKIGLANTPQNRQKFLNSPQLQDKLFSIILSDLAKKYNNDMRKVAAAYYGGDAGARVVGTKAGDKPQYAGGKRYPSINQYVTSVINRMG